MIGAGQTIGNYRILSKIGTGGMGAVFLAEHPLIGKKVALKVIHRELAGNKEVVSRFFQEARAANAIGNEHIVEIHDFGVTPENDHFYIMEYLEGRTLASVLTHETVLHPLRVLHIGAQIASALGAAHASGVLHRDLKPDNIMLLPRLGDPDFVKVLDFGLAKIFQGGGQGDQVKTAAGVLLGTPQYMSPEACEGKRVLDHRTDVYALGILLFQMATGRLPFDGDSMGEVLVKQVTALPPAPRGINPTIPPAVEQVILRALAKHPDTRFQSMEELRSALVDPDGYLSGSPPVSPARSIAPGEAPMNAAMLQTFMAAQPKSAVPTGRDPVPGLGAPNAPKQNTMRIGTPAGYVSRPARRIWPIILVIGLLLGLGGGAFGVAWMNRDSSARAEEPTVVQMSSDPGPASGSAAVAATVADAATAAVAATVTDAVAVAVAVTVADAETVADAVTVADAATVADAETVADAVADAATVADAAPMPDARVLDAASAAIVRPPDAPPSDAAPGKKPKHPKQPTTTTKPPGTDTDLMAPE